ncbi:MAG: hypothetical protein KDD99_20565 [Bacteroidetes bacterium]|nr:hypothetical protein [Bacteroidota bacterium]
MQSETTSYSQKSPSQTALKQNRDNSSGFLRNLSTFLHALGSVAITNIFSIILVILLYLFYWAFPQAKDLLLIINHGNDPWVILFYLSLVTLATICWYLPRFAYQETCYGDSRFRSIFYTKHLNHLYDAYSYTQTTKSERYTALFKEMLPRTLGTMVILVASFGILNVGDEMTGKPLLGIPAGWLLTISLAVLLLLHIGHVSFATRLNKIKIKPALALWGPLLIGGGTTIILLVLRSLNTRDEESLTLVFLSGIIIAISFFLFTVFRKRASEVYGEKLGKMAENFGQRPMFKTRSRSPEKPFGWRIKRFFEGKNMIMISLTSLGLISGVMFFIYNFFPAISQKCNPLFCANITFIFYLSILYFLQIGGNQKSINIVFFAILSIFIINAFTENNDYHEISTAKESYNPHQREALEDYFGQ